MGVSRIAFAIFLAVGLLSGCGKESANAPKKSIAVFTADPSVVIARVGERDITVGDFRRQLDFETAIHRVTMMKAKKPPKDPEERVRKFSEFRARQILPKLVHCALLDRYLDASCGGREVDGAEKVVGKGVKRYANKLRQKGMTLEDLAKKLSVDPAFLKDQMLLSAREEKARLVFDPASTNVTEREIDEGLARLDAFIARAVASNRVTRATCSKALEKVRAGAGFAATAKAFGVEDPHEAEEWGWFSRDDFDMMAKDCPQFKDWAFKAKVGEIGGPFDVDDGLSIVKVLERQAGTAQPSMASGGTEEVRLARINFPMAEENPEPRTREHCKDALLAWKAGDAQKRLFGKLFNETKIDYPNGAKMNFSKEECK